MRGDFKCDIGGSKECKYVSHKRNQRNFIDCFCNKAKKFIEDMKRCPK